MRLYDNHRGIEKKRPFATIKGETERVNSIESLESNVPSAQIRMPSTKREAKIAAAMLFGEVPGAPSDQIQSRNLQPPYNKKPPRKSHLKVTSRPLVNGLYRHIDRHLKRLQSFERDFLYLHLVDEEKSNRLGLVSVILFSNSHTKQIDVEDIFCVASFAASKNALRREPKEIIQIRDLGWRVSSEVAESNGHAIERLNQRLAGMGWSKASSL